MSITVDETLRILHVLGAVVWAGGAMFALVILGPGVRAAGEAGQRFMKALGERGGPARLMGPAGIVTVLTGIGLYWQREWWREPFIDPVRTVLSVAAILGILVFTVGMAVGMPMQKRMARVAKSIGPGGPTPEQQSELKRLGQRVGVFGTTFSWLLVVVLVLMVGRNFAA